MKSINQHHLRLLEAVLFSSTEPLGERNLAALLPSDADLRGLLATLQQDYADRGVHLVRAGETWSFVTAPDLADDLRRESASPAKLSRVAADVTIAVETARWLKSKRRLASMKAKV